MPTLTCLTRTPKLWAMSLPEGHLSRAVWGWIVAGLLVSLLSMHGAQVQSPVLHESGVVVHASSASTEREVEAEGLEVLGLSFYIMNLKLF